MDASVVSPLVDASCCMVAGDIVPVTEVVGDDLLGTTVVRGAAVQRGHEPTI